MTKDNRRRRPLAVLGHAYRGRRSSALVIVLGCLVLISVLIVAFFASVSSERQSAQFYANNSSVKLLADSAVDIVMGQIKDATGGTDSQGQTLAWASQPGMIRTYNTQGQAAGYFKLYSWNNMIGTAAFHTSDSTEIPPSTWYDYPALYTDLNEPSGGVYPIVDPSATNTVKGFSITSAPVSTIDAAPMPVQWLYVLQDGSLASATAAGPGNTVSVPNATTNNPITARIAFWTDDDTSKINVNTAAGDVWTNTSTANPPGAFWDTPRIYSAAETNFMAMSQPTHGEFQRYPGHPATTYLTAVFPGLTTNQLYAITPRVNGGGSLSGTKTITSSLLVPAKTDRLYASVDEMIFGTNRTVNVPFSNTQVQSANFFLTAHSRAPEVNLYNEPRIVTWPVNATTSASYRTAFDSLMAFDGSLMGTNGTSGSLGTNAYYFQRADSMSASNDLPAAADATGVGRNRVLIQYLQNLTSQPVPGFSTHGETFLSKYPGAGSVSDRDQILTEIFDYIRCLNSQDVSATAAATPMTNTFTPTTDIPGTGYNMMPAQAGQITPIYDSVTKTRGFGRFPTISEASLLIAGIGQTTSSATNYPVYATNFAGYSGPGSFYFSPYGTSYGVPETWATAAANWSSYSGSGATATNCAPGFTRVHPAFVGNLFVPAVGYASLQANYWIEVDGLNSFSWTDGKGGTYPMFPPSRATTTTSIYGAYDQYGGYVGIGDFTDANGYFGPPNTENVDGFPYVGVVAYPNYGNTLDVPTGGTISCSGGTVTVKLRGPSKSGYSGYVVGPTETPGPVLQTISITFPGFTCPVPKLAPSVEDNTGDVEATTNDFRDIGQRFSSKGSNPKMAWITSQDVVRSMVLDSTKMDARVLATMTTVPATAGFFIPGPNYNSSTAFLGHGIVNGTGLRGTATVPLPYLGTYYGKLVPNVSYTTNAALVDPVNGCTTNGLTYYNTVNLQSVAQGGYGNNGQNVTAAIPVAFSSAGSAIGGGAATANGVFAGGGISTVPGDWDTGTGPYPDGPFINKADEGDILYYTGSGGVPQLPYFASPNMNSYLVSTNFFSPNRMMPSPAMFGSLPTGAITQKPWQTLLFRPDPGASTPHIGSTSPADHLFLDLFNMPVVEPYPISDPFSTAGKINMNYQIVPFTYITRSTGVQAVLRSEEMLAIPTGDGPTYKLPGATNRRYFIDLNETLTGFNNRFNSDDIFSSATEICSIWLVPAGLSQTYAGMQSFWTGTGGSNGALTGDNVRERPYANIYPRLTTKSNTFTVHYRVQTLKKVPTTTAPQWVEGTDVVTGEYRGSTTLERYLDPSDPRIPDYATATQPLAAGQAIDNFYKFRVIETKQFNP